MLYFENHFVQFSSVRFRPGSSRLAKKYVVANVAGGHKGVFSREFPNAAAVVVVVVVS